VFYGTGCFCTEYFVAGVFVAGYLLGVLLLGVLLLGVLELFWLLGVLWCWCVLYWVFLLLEYFVYWVFLYWKYFICWVFCCKFCTGILLLGVSVLNVLLNILIQPLW